MSKLNFWSLEQRMVHHCWYGLVVHFGNSWTKTEVAHLESPKDRTKCDKMLLKVSGWSFTVSGSSYWILAKSKFLMPEELTLVLRTRRFILGIQCLLLTMDPSSMPFSRLGVSGMISSFTVNMWYLWVNTATQALHTQLMNTPLLQLSDESRQVTCH